MHKRLIALSALALIASPAHATGGFQCRTAASPSIEITLAFGHTAGSGLFSQHLRVDGKGIPAVAPQWWLDDDQLRVVLTDTQANERLAIVKAKRNGDAYDGSVVYQGRRHWIRCRES
jgi:hypothetical protein